MYVLIFRCGFLPSEAIASCPPDSALDSALVLHIDSKCRSLDVISSSLQPSELVISESELISSHLVVLQGNREKRGRRRGGGKRSDISEHYQLKAGFHIVAISVPYNVFNIVCCTTIALCCGIIWKR